MLCCVLCVSRSGFYDYVAGPETEREKRDATFAAKTRTMLAEHMGHYGSPRVHRELCHRGDVVSTKKVAQLMRDSGLVTRKKKRFRATTDSTHEDPSAANFQRPRLHGEGHQRGLDDRRDRGLDPRGMVVPRGHPRPVLATRRRLGDEDQQRPIFPLDALRVALDARRPPPGLLHRSDRGTPTRAKTIAANSVARASSQAEA